MKKANRDKTTILITGGHLTPALAVIQELQDKGYSKFVWVGRNKTMRRDKEFSAEYKMINNQYKIPFVNLLTGKIIRFDSLRSFYEFFKNLFKIPIGFLHSLLVFIKYRPALIISFGGYIALPVVIIGKMFRTPSITHEQTVVTGLANKIVSKFVDKILISWKSTGKQFDKTKVKLVGNPIRKEVLTISTNNFHLNDKLKTIYITGGNQGAHVINNAIEPLIPDLLKKYNVIHQTGLTSITGDYEKFLKLEKSTTGKTKGKYIVEGQIFGSEIGEVFSKADLVISRSGANIVTELLALKKMCILIPIPWSINNEQLKNAKIVEKTGIGYVVEEMDLKTEVLDKTIKSAFKYVSKGKSFFGKSLRQSQKKAESMVKLNAVKNIVKEIEKLLK